jgi:hypothetical protein
MDYVDAYCERLAPGFWGEPLNALSNLGFLVAAAVIWFRFRPDRTSLRLLVVLLALIGLGSLSFHTVANQLTRVFDVLFIVLFVFFYVVCFAHWFLGWRWATSWLFAPGLAVLGVAMIPLSRLVPEGSGTYLVALVALFGLAVGLRVGRADLRHHWPSFGIAAALFLVSLTLRTADNGLCAPWPVGTHYLWHLLNALVLYLVARAAVLRVREVSPPRSALSADRP